MSHVPRLCFPLLTDGLLVSRARSDSGFVCGSSHEQGVEGNQATPYEKQSNPGGQCSTGLQFDAPAPDLFGFWVSNEAPKDAPLSIVSIVDELKVPKDANGQFLLSWRWDCEQTPQVWNSCADIVIE
jgi:hypothetical protein